MNPQPCNYLVHSYNCVVQSMKLSCTHVIVLSYDCPTHVHYQSDLTYLPSWPLNYLQAIETLLNAPLCISDL